MQQKTKFLKLEELVSTEIENIVGKGENAKMLVTSIFYFFHAVFKCFSV